MSVINLCSWNVNGIRAVAKKGFFEWLNSSDLDMLGIQETKIAQDQIPTEFQAQIKYPISVFNSAERRGYSGVANYFSEKFKPIEIKLGFDKSLFITQAPELEVWEASKTETCYKVLGIESPSAFEQKLNAYNSEGRIIETHHQVSDKRIIILNIYFPNGGSGLERLKFKLEFYETLLLYLKELQKITKYIVITGDYNTAHHVCDLARPKENINTSGFMNIEREYLDRLFALGFLDSFRYLHPDLEDSYTWWSFRTAARSRNIGWRIDYFWISEALKPCLREASIKTEVLGSDHCPVFISLEL